MTCPLLTLVNSIFAFSIYTNCQFLCMDDGLCLLCAVVDVRCVCFCAVGTCTCVWCGVCVCVLVYIVYV